MARAVNQIDKDRLTRGKNKEKKQFKSTVFRKRNVAEGDDVG